MTTTQLDRKVLSFVPKADDHVHFNTIVQRFRAATDWEMERGEMEALVHDSLKSLEKGGWVQVKSYPDTPLCYSRC